MKNIFLFILLSPFLALAQNLKGTILNSKTKQPIQYANVSINQINETAITDERGKFNLKLYQKAQEYDSLYVSHIGYATKKISLLGLKKSDYLIYLEEQIENLNGVKISSNYKELKSKILFTKLAPLKYAISSFGSILKDNKIYVIGGDGSFKTDAWKKVQYEKPGFTLDEYLSELQFQFSGNSYKNNLLIYDIQTNQWETSEIKFKKRAYHNLNIYNNSIYVLGGKRVSTNGKFEYLEDKIEVFDTNKNTITIDNTNPHQASNFASFTYNGSIITIGGSIKMSENGKKTYTNKVHSYDIKSGYWYELTSMPTAKEVKGVLIKDKIYLIGGSNGKSLSSIESFDLITGTWNTEGELLNSIEHPTMTNNNDIIYFFENEKINTYDIKTKVLKEYLVNLPLKASKLYFCDGKLYILGGYLENYYSQYPSASLFSIDISEFENTKPNRVKNLQNPL